MAHEKLGRPIVAGDCGGRWMGVPAGNIAEEEGPDDRVLEFAPPRGAVERSVAAELRKRRRAIDLKLVAVTPASTDTDPGRRVLCAGTT